MLTWLDIVRASSVRSSHHRVAAVLGSKRSPPGSPVSPREVWLAAADSPADSIADAERLPVGVAAKIIILMSLAAWALIATVVLWLIRVT